MNQISRDIPLLGTPMEGGFFGAAYLDENMALAGLIVASKAAGEFRDVQWRPRSKNVPGATSLLDGLANTQAMAEAGSKIAQQILELEVHGIGGWSIGALDQMTALRANLFPRAGITPAQTAAEVFREGAPEAFDPVLYWTSTQYDADFAWLQDFNDGYQGYDFKDFSYRVRAVRKILL